MKLTDADPMPMGKTYRGVPMCDVPAWHLLWLYDHNYCTPPVRAYIEDNLQALRTESERSKRKEYPKRCCDCVNMYKARYGFSEKLFCRIGDRRVEWRQAACDNFEK